MFYFQCPEIKRADPELSTKHNMPFKKVSCPFNPDQITVNTPAVPPLPQSAQLHGVLHRGLSLIDTIYKCILPLHLHPKGRNK